MHSRHHASVFLASLYVDASLLVNASTHTDGLPVCVEVDFILRMWPSLLILRLHQRYLSASVFIFYVCSESILTLAYYALSFIGKFESYEIHALQFRMDGIRMAMRFHLNVISMRPFTSVFNGPEPLLGIIDATDKLLLVLKETNMFHWWFVNYYPTFYVVFDCSPNGIFQSFVNIIWMAIKSFN